jgi:hypothetical protein
MKKSLIITIGAFVLCSVAALTVRAYSIDYLGMAANFSPVGTPGMNGDVTISSTVAPGSTITGDITYSINTQGNTTTFPKTIGFGSTPPNVSVTGLSSHTWDNATQTFTDTITITAPATLGAHTVNISANSGTGGQHGLTGGNGIRIHFTVAVPPPGCEPVTPTLAVTSPVCMVLHNPNPVTLTATLTDPNTNAGISGKTVSFTVDGNSAGSGMTNGSGVATTGYDASALSVGDHTVVASWTSDDTCNYNIASGNGTLGVTYVFLGFQQPINADGSSIFKGTVIPVKIKIADYNGAPITDAEAHVFFAFGTPAIVGDTAEPLANTNSDSGNLMRYDATANQYIFNWDISRLANGAHTVRVDLREGACGTERSVVLSINRVGRGR